MIHNKTRNNETTKFYSSSHLRQVLILLLVLLFNILPSLILAQENSGGETQGSVDNYFNLLQDQ